MKNIMKKLTLITIMMLAASETQCLFYAIGQSLMGLKERLSQKKPKLLSLEDQEKQGKYDENLKIYKKIADLTLLKRIRASSGEEHVAACKAINVMPLYEKVIASAILIPFIGFTGWSIFFKKK